MNNRINFENAELSLSYRSPVSNPALVGTLGNTKLQDAKNSTLFNSNFGTNGVRICVSGFLLLCLTFCLFLFNSNEVFSIAPNPSTYAKCDTTRKSGPCGECPDGSKPYGTGGITCGKVNKIFDFGLEMGITIPTMYELQKTSVFFPDDEDTLTKTGKGYIGATVEYNRYVKRWDKYVYSYILCDAIEFTDYDEWLKACYDFYGVRETETYSNNLILIYPNPTNSTTFIKFNPEIVSKIDDRRIIINLYYND